MPEPSLTGRTSDGSSRRRLVVSGTAGGEVAGSGATAKGTCKGGLAKEEGGRVGVSSVISQLGPEARRCVPALGGWGSAVTLQSWRWS